MTKSEKHARASGKSRDGDRENDRDESPEDNQDNNRVDDLGDNRPEDRDDAREPGETRPTVDSGDSKLPAPEQQGRQDSDDRRARSGPLVWLALLLALASLGLASYLYWSNGENSASDQQPGPSASEFGQLVDRVDKIRQETAAGIGGLRDDLGKLSVELEAEEPGPDAGVLAQRIDRLSAELETLADAPGPDDSALAQRIDQLSARVESALGERNSAMAGVRTRLGELESEVGRRLEQFELELSNVGSNLDQADRDLATRLLLTEVDSLFAIAQNQLLTGGTDAVALQSWERAMERLTTLEGADFRALKESARREFRQLQDYQPPDLAMQVERLFAMTDAVAEWPARTVQPGQQRDEAGRPDGWRGRMGQVLGSLVRVESVDREFLGPDEIDMARERVHSTLQTAAFAMVRSRPDLARRLMGEAADAVHRVFDVEAADVAEALIWLEDAAADDAPIDSPDLKESRAEISRLLGEMR